MFINWTNYPIIYIARAGPEDMANQLMQVTKSPRRVPVAAVVVLGLVLVFGLFVVGFDQGHILSMAFGEQAFEDMYIHELTHDLRHAAGFPCH